MVPRQFFPPPVPDNQHILHGLDVLCHPNNSESTETNTKLLMPTPL